MSTPPLRSIGVLARQTGCTVPTIRYYEQIGLLPTGQRTAAGRRVYGEGVARRLGFIRRCRDFGFPIEQVRELVTLMDEAGRPCAEVREVAARHLAAIRQKLAALQMLEADVSAFVGGCDAACAGGPAVDCTILEDLAGSGAPRAHAAPPPCCGALPACPVPEPTR